MAGTWRAKADYYKDKVERARRHRFTVRGRLKALEDEVQEMRMINRRAAELTDVVVELLIPLSDRDTAKVDEALDTYSRSI